MSFSFILSKKSDHFNFFISYQNSQFYYLLYIARNYVPDILKKTIFKKIHFLMVVVFLYLYFQTIIDISFSTEMDFEIVHKFVGKV